jgi:hypothetical protein
MLYATSPLCNVALPKIVDFRAGLIVSDFGKEVACVLHAEPKKLDILLQLPQPIEKKF